MPSLQGKAEFSFSHHSIICKENEAKGRAKAEKKKKSSILAPQAARQPAYTPEWHTCTHCYSSPPAPAICSQKAKGRGFPHTHTTNWHLISQPKGWLAQRWLRLCLCPTQRTTLSSCWPWASSRYLTTLQLMTALYLQYSSLPLSPYPPSCPPRLFSRSSPFCTAPLCTAPVLPHSQGGITRQNAGSGGKEGGRDWKWRRRGGQKLAGSPFVCRRSVTVLVADEI